MVKHITHAIKKKSSILLAVLFLILFILISVKFIFQAKRANDELIAQQLVQLDQIFKKINETCKISSFSNQTNYIDFLNVKKFSGNSVGSMNLIEPENWQGPYLENNLVIEGIEYQIIKTKKGHYILPGDGVLLANGITIGKNLTVNYETDFEKLIRDPKKLLSSGNPLALYIEVSDNPMGRSNDELISEHIALLADIFKRINKACQILGFRNKSDVIDFLNVQKFSGSIIGSMNLKNPINWQGPYLEKNLSIDGKYYQIIKTKSGYFIIPPDNTYLSNGKIIGRNLIINQDSDIQSLMLDPNGLMSGNKVLATRIDLWQTPFEQLSKDDLLAEDPNL